MKSKFSKTKVSIAVALAIPFLGTWLFSQAEVNFPTKFPIKYLVVIFQENVSFDHYFATYPSAENRPGERVFKARPDTPSVNGLTEAFLKPNNLNKAQPFRLNPSQQLTCDQIHDYTPEQKAYNAGLLDKFVEYT